MLVLKAIFLLAFLGDNFTSCAYKCVGRFLRFNVATCTAMSLSFVSLRLALGAAWTLHFGHFCAHVLCHYAGVTAHHGSPPSSQKGQGVRGCSQELGGREEGQLAVFLLAGASVSPGGF